MKRIFLLWCLTAGAMWAYPSLNMTSAPTNVNNGQSYYIEAQCWDSWGGVTVTIYKDNVYFASSYGTSPVYAGGSTSDTGPKTVTYRIEAVNDYWETDTIYHYVNVAAPPNNPPTIQWVTNPSTVTVNQNFTVQAKGMDQDGNLTNVFVWREWTPFAFNGGGNGYENTSDGNWHSQSTAGTINFQAQAKDSNDATSQTLTHTVTVVKLDQTITFNQPAAQTYGGQLALSASASSGLGVSFSVVSGPASLSGNTLTFTGAGSVVVRASQGGNGTYNAAPNVDRTITVNKANQAVVTITSSNTMTYGNAYTATASGGSGTGAITWSLGTGSTAAGAAINASTGAVTGNSAGTVVIRAQRAGDANYNASALTADFTITVAARQITVTLSGAKTYDGNNTASGAGLSVTTGSLASGDSLASYTSTAAITAGQYPLTAGQVAITNASVPTTRTGSYWITYAGSYSITPRAITVTLSGSKPYDGNTTPTGATASITNGTLVAGDQVSFTFGATSSATPGSYSGLASTSITNASAPTTRTSNYNITYAGNYTIDAAVITGVTFTPFVYDGTPHAPSHTTIASTTPAGATVTVSAAAQTSPGTYTNATVTGTGNYTGTLNNVSWTIAKATPIPNFPGPRNLGAQTLTTYTVQAADLNAVLAPVGSGATPTGTVTYSIHSASGSGASPTSGFVTTSTVFTLGTYVIRASYPGDDNYQAVTVDATWQVVIDADGDDILDYIEAQLGTDPSANNHEEDSANENDLNIHYPIP